MPSFDLLFQYQNVVVREGVASTRTQKEAKEVAYVAAESHLTRETFQDKAVVDGL